MSCPLPSEDIVTPAFGVARRRTALGVRLEGRTGNFPSSGLSPNKFTAVSEAALYVLMNRRKHGGDDRGLDPCSSALYFDGWREPVGTAPQPAPVVRARTWLAAVGWRRHGLLHLDERPRACVRRAGSVRYHDVRDGRRLV